MRSDCYWCCGTKTDPEGNPCSECAEPVQRVQQRYRVWVRETYQGFLDVTADSETNAIRAAVKELANGDLQEPTFHQTIQTVERVLQ